MWSRNHRRRLFVHCFRHHSNFCEKTDPIDAGTGFRFILCRGDQANEPDMKIYCLKRERMMLNGDQEYRI